MSEEEWRPVVGWEDQYEVSDHGGIRSIARYLGCRGGGRILYKARVRRPMLNRHGYPVVTMEARGKKKILKSVHRAVVEAFVGPIPSGMVINHLDGVKTNNHISNLEACTCQQNSRHMVDVLNKMNGERHPHSILTDAGANEIVSLVLNGFDHHAVAEAYGVTRCTVGLIMRGKQWQRATGRKRQTFSFPRVASCYRGAASKGRSVLSLRRRPAGSSPGTT